MIERRRSQAAGERDGGLISAELALAIGLVFIPIVFLVLAVVQWPERQGIAVGAAAEGARAAALADSPESARVAMTERVSEVLASAGIDPAAATARLDGRFAPGEHITVSVTVDMPAVAAPLIGTYSVSDYTASATERIELHRTFQP